MKNGTFKNPNESRQHSDGRQSAIAAPVSRVVAPNEESIAGAKLELLGRLTEAAHFIRSESEQLKIIGFSDRATRLMRILGEAVEEQKVSLQAESGK